MTFPQIDLSKLFFREIERPEAFLYQFIPPAGICFIQVFIDFINEPYFDTFRLPVKRPIRAPKSITLKLNSRDFINLSIGHIDNHTTVCSGCVYIIPNLLTVILPSFFSRSDIAFPIDNNLYITVIRLNGDTLSWP